MNIEIEVQGLKGVEDALAQAGPKLAKRALRKALTAAAQPMVTSAKSYAPVLTKATKQRRPGELRDSVGMTIKLSPKGESGTVRVGPVRDKAKDKQDPGIWGLFVEFGSVHGAAQPFMRPAFEQSNQPALDKFTDVIRAAVPTLNK